MKICPKCGKKWPDEFNACPACGCDLTNSPIYANLNMGNANAISGGVHSADDHSAHDSNNQTNSNNASNSYNTTNHTIINQASKSEAEKIKENIHAYRLKCKELFVDGLLAEDGESQLHELQEALNLADELVLPIKEEIRIQTKKRKKQISQVGLTDIHQTKSIIEQNIAPALQRQLVKLEAWIQEYDDNALNFVYYQMSALLEPVRYTNRYEDSTKEEYWETFWAYIAYILQNREKQANEVLASLGRWHAYFPEQNDVVLQLTGKLMLNDNLDDIIQVRNALSVRYTPDLQLLLDAIDELLQMDWTKEYISIRPAHAFYINTLFANFVETQKAQGVQRLIEQREFAKKKREEEEKRIHEEELAQQAAAKAKAEADAEAARLAAEKQNAENLANAQELARKQREAQEAAEAAAKAEAERIEQKRIAAAEEEARKRQEEERRKKEARIAWIERNLWKIVGAILAVIIIIVTIKYVQNKKAEDAEKEARIMQLKKDELKYQELCNTFVSQMKTVTFDGAFNAEKALETLHSMKALEQAHPQFVSGGDFSYISGKRKLVSKVENILSDLENAENDPFCEEQDKAEIRTKKSMLKQVLLQLE